MNQPDQQPPEPGPAESSRTAAPSGCRTLVLIPTRLEREKLSGDWLQRKGVECRLCGFGPVAAAVESASLISALHPQRVVLAGIAGSYTARQLGEVATFASVAMADVGARQEHAILLPSQLGFACWEPSGLTPPKGPKNDAVFERLQLHPPAGQVAGGELLTVSAASGGPADVKQRRLQFPAATAEDMEGFAVALAAYRTSLPTTIVRGISNVAGERDVGNWKIGEAMRAVDEWLEEYLSSS